MKRILFVIAILINGSVYVYGQTVGDFQSRQSGNWNDYNTWNRWNGSSWVAAISGQTPGAANSATIQSSHIITINVAAACTNLSIDGIWSNTGNYTAAISGNLTVNSGATFTAGTGVYTLSGTTKTIGGTITSLTIPSLTISGSYTNNLTGSGL
ncbi:MAG: hypothetical protein Q8880_11780, partial [Bacteroidota bacterium]|nr:hypothetical protein [Bacteroidota bacterium]